jgi:hypothetical protein
MHWTFLLLACLASDKGEVACLWNIWRKSWSLWCVMWKAAYIISSIPSPQRVHIVLGTSSVQGRYVCICVYKMSWEVVEWFWEENAISVCVPFVMSTELQTFKIILSTNCHQYSSAATLWSYYFNIHKWSAYLLIHCLKILSGTVFSVEGIVWPTCDMLKSFINASNCCCHHFWYDCTTTMSTITSIKTLSLWTVA